MAVTVQITAAMPDAELEGFLRLLRAWDATRTDRTLRILVDMPGGSAETAEALLTRLGFDTIVRVDAPNVG